MNTDSFDMDTLQMLENAGVINIEAATEALKQQQREAKLACHKYAINRTGDGRWITWVPDPTRPKGCRKIAKTHMKDLEDAIIDAYSPKIVSMESMLKEWLSYKERFVKPHTISQLLKIWNKYYINEGIVCQDISTITPRDIQLWSEGLIEREAFTRQQWIQVRVILNQMFWYAHREGYIKSNPMDSVGINTRRVKPRRKKSGASQVFSNKELRIFKQVAWDDFAKRCDPVTCSRYKTEHQLLPLAILFMFMSGLRVSEICAMNWSDITENRLHVNRMLDVEGYIRDRTKGTYGDRYVPLVPEAEDLLSTAKKRQVTLGVYEQDGYVFSVIPWEPASYSRIQKLFRQYCEKCGLEARSTHSARKTFASMLFNHGVSVDAVREMLGHVDSHTTMQSYIYNTVSETDMIGLIGKSFQYSTNPSITDDAKEPLSQDDCDR